jgi:hypothetical protein
MLAIKPEQVEMASPRSRNETGVTSSWTYNGLPRYNEKSRMTTNHKIGFHRTQIK